MKKYFKPSNSFKILLAVIVLLLTINSCEEEIDIIMEGESVPIIYCLIDPFDTLHYVRVSKTYLPDNEINKIPLSADSLYYQGEIEVSLEHWVDNQAIETIIFQKQTEIIKDQGLFPNENNTLFMANCKIYAEDKYKLYVYIKESGLIIDAEAVMVGELDVIDPDPSINRKITLLENEDYTVRLNFASDAWIYQSTARFNYLEIIGQDTLAKHFNWVLNAAKPGNDLTNVISINMNGSRFYQEMIKNISENQDVIRKAKNMDIIIHFGGIELCNYVESISPSTSVLQEKPSYTNFKYCEGVFSSLGNKEINKIPLSQVFIDSIAKGNKTRILNFLDSNN